MLIPKIVLVSVFCLSQFFSLGQTQTQTNIQFTDPENKSQKRTIHYHRKARASTVSSARLRTNNELNLTKRANSSMKQERERLAQRRIIRKDKSSIKNEDCDKNYNAYVQHECFAFDHPTVHTDSISLNQNELIVLLKTKKYFYRVCLMGETYYVKRESKL